MRLGGIDTKTIVVADRHTALSGRFTPGIDAAFDEAHVAMPYVRSKRLAALLTTSERPGGTSGPIHQIERT